MQPRFRHLSSAEPRNDTDGGCRGRRRRWTALTGAEDCGWPHRHRVAARRRVDMSDQQTHLYLTPVSAERAEEFERFLLDVVAPAVAAQRPELVGRWRLLRPSQAESADDTVSPTPSSSTVATRRRTGTSPRCSLCTTAKKKDRKSVV